MTISLALRRWAAVAIEPMAKLELLRRRLRSRRDLERLLQDAYLLDDVGFSRQAVERELARGLFDKPVNLRRG